ncbi:MAG: hypothetical protein M1343_02600 [Chloroflexi bacterium]|nr:hypothetical protein [Chloroflexota bacterium]MDA8188114.1 hypothetical protein [Dehalococcoidales bacterium]
MNLWIVALAVFVLNLPFGYWRANVRKFSLQWILSIHAPVVLAIALRIVSGLGWQLATVPVLLGVFSLGQFLGGTIHGLWRRQARASASSCLIWDVVRELRRTASRD